jgi:hypothetical protein
MQYQVWQFPIFEVTNRQEEQLYPLTDIPWQYESLGQFCETQLAAPLLSSTLSTPRGLENTCSRDRARAVRTSSRTAALGVLTVARASRARWSTRFRCASKERSTLSEPRCAKPAPVGSRLMFARALERVSRRFCGGCWSGRCCLHISLWWMQWEAEGFLTCDDTAMMLPAEARTRLIVESFMLMSCM